MPFGEYGKANVYFLYKQVGCHLKTEPRYHEQKNRHIINSN